MRLLRYARNDSTEGVIARRQRRRGNLTAYNEISILLCTFVLLCFCACFSYASTNPMMMRYENGLTVILLEEHSVPLVSLQVWVACGSVNEEKKLYGISHFLEHMLFKGTKSFGPGEIAKVIENGGGYINAATSNEVTHYYVDIQSAEILSGLKALSEAVLVPSFPEEEFVKERTVILDEIRRYKDSPTSELWEELMELMYPDTPYGHRVIGSEETVGGMAVSDLMEYHKKWYVPENIVVVAIGDLDAVAMQPKIEEAFGISGMKAKAVFDRPVNGVPLSALVQRILQGQKKVIHKPVQQGYLGCGFVGPELDNPDQAAMDVLAEVLGGGASSRLYRRLREEKQLCWDISSHFLTHRGSGAFIISAESSPEKITELNQSIVAELKAFLQGKPDKKELDRAKAQIRSSWIFGHETNSGQASSWGYFTTMGRPELVKNYLKKVMNVSPEDVTRVLKKYWNGTDMVTVILLPEK